MSVRKFLLGLSLALLLLLPQPALAYGPIPVIDYTHIAVSLWAEYLRYAQAAYSIIQRAEQIYNQYQQIAYQVQALKKLNFHNWRDIGPLYHQLTSILNQADAVSYAVTDLDHRFTTIFPGSQAYTDYPAEHLAQVTSTLDTLRYTLGATQKIDMDNRGSLQTLGDLQNQMSAAEGDEQALESLGEFASWQSSQMATMGSTLEIIANVDVLNASYAINQEARIQQGKTDLLTATLDNAQTDTEQPAETFPLLPNWVPQ